MSIDAVTAMGIVLGVVGAGWVQAEWRLMLAKDRAAERLNLIEAASARAVEFWRARGDDYCSKLTEQIARNVDLVKALERPAPTLRNARRRAKPVSVNQ